MVWELLIFLVGSLQLVVSGGLSGESLPQQVHLAATGEFFVRFRLALVTHWAHYVEVSQSARSLCMCLYPPGKDPAPLWLPT